MSRHHDSSQHQKSVAALKNTQKLNFRPSAAAQTQKEKVRPHGYFVSLLLLRTQVIRVEVKVANLLFQHNVPLAVTDHLSPLLKDIFSDSAV